MKAEGKREHEMKAILCGLYVKGKRRVGERGREMEVLLVHLFTQQSTAECYALLCIVQSWVLGM